MYKSASPLLKSAPPQPNPNPTPTHSPHLGNGRSSRPSAPELLSRTNFQSASCQRHEGKQQLAMQVGPFRGHRVWAKYLNSQTHTYTHTRAHSTGNPQERNLHPGNFRRKPNSVETCEVAGPWMVNHAAATFARLKLVHRKDFVQSVCTSNTERNQRRNGGCKVSAGFLMAEAPPRPSKARINPYEHLGV